MHWHKTATTKSKYLRKLRLTFDFTAALILLGIFISSAFIVRAYYNEREQVGSSIAIRGVVQSVAYGDAAHADEMDHTFCFTTSNGVVNWRAGDQTRYIGFVRQNLDDIIASGDIRIDNIRVMGVTMNSTLYYGGIDNTMEFASDAEKVHDMIWELTGIYAALVIAVIGLSFVVQIPAKDAWEKQNTFLGNASHELKTPLAVIQASNELQVQKHGESEYTKNIQDQVSEMSDMIADLIAETHLEGVAKPIKTIDLSEFVNPQALAIDSLMYESHISYTVDVEPNLKAAVNESDLKVLFRQLINNAVKYCEGEKRITVSLKCVKRTITFSIFNTGCRLKQAEVDKIFNRFYRGEEVTNIPGSGLGLSIVKSIADTYHYKLAVDARPGESFQIDILIKKK